MSELKEKLCSRFLRLSVFLRFRKGRKMSFAGRVVLEVVMACKRSRLELESSACQLSTMADGLRRLL